MRFLDQLKTDRRKLREMNDNRQRLNFIWDYYKFPILALLLVIVIAVTSLISNIGRTGVCMYAVLINNDSIAIDCDMAVFDDLLKEAGLDIGKKKTDIQADYSLGRAHEESEDMETLQILNALFLFNSVDVYVSDKEYFDYFAEVGAFADLSLLIDQELLSGLDESDCYYQDASGHPALTGIYLHEGSPLHEAGFYHNDVIIGVANGGENLDYAVELIKQLLRDRN